MGCGAALALGQDAGAPLHLDISMPGVFSVGFLTFQVLLSITWLSTSTKTSSSGLSSPANMMGRTNVTGRSLSQVPL